MTSRDEAAACLHVRYPGHIYGVAVNLLAICCLSLPVSAVVMTVTINEDSREEVWIFGFGSLIWKAGFEFSRRVEGYIKDYRRVFYQGSTDHRGSPGAPGRVVTLEVSPGARCWGAAYLLTGSIEQQRKTLQYLEWREKQYDLRVRVDVFGKESDHTPILRGVLTYIASEDRTKNLYYLGMTPREAIAQQIASAVGPSGPNYEYLYGLAEALEQMDVYEEDLVWLARRVREIRAALQISSTVNATIDSREASQQALSNGATDADSLQNDLFSRREAAAKEALQLQAEKDLQFAVPHVSAAGAGPDGGAVP